MRFMHETSLALYKAAYKLRWRDGFFSHNWLLLLTYPTVLCILGLIFAKHNSAMQGLCFNLAYFLITFWTVIPALRFYEIRDAYRNSRPDLHASQACTTEIDANQIISVMPGLRQTAYDWASVLSFAQNESVTVVRMIGHHFVFFPTSALNPEQQAELNELVSRHGTRRFS